MRIASLVVTASTLISLTAAADDWPAAHPRSWHGRGFERVVEVFPAKSRMNTTDKPLAYAYQMGYPAGRWAVDPKLVWKGPLANTPYQAIISDHGYLVTFDDWGNLGYDNAVVIYDPKGKLVKSWKLDDLGIPADVANRDRSVSSRYWRKDAKYVFDTKRNVVQIQLAKAGVLELSLADGKRTYNATPGKPINGNDEVEIWETSLRFSSITDVIAAKTPPAAPPTKQPSGSGGDLGGFPGKAGCDFDAEVKRGDEAATLGNHAAALAAFQKALACKPDGSVLRRAYVAACNSKNNNVAKALFKALGSPDPLLQICIRQGFDPR